MAHLLAQPQQKLQLNYKTTITQNCQKIELYGSSTTKELKSHSFRHVEVVEMKRCRNHRDMEWTAPHPRVVDKNWEGCLRSEGS